MLNSVKPEEKTPEQERRDYLRKGVETIRNLIVANGEAFVPQILLELFPPPSPITPVAREELISKMGNLRASYHRKYDIEKRLVSVTEHYYTEYFGKDDPTDEAEQKLCVAGVGGHSSVYGFRELGNDVLSRRVTVQHSNVAKGTHASFMSRVNELVLLMTDKERQEFLDKLGVPVTVEDQKALPVA